MNKLPTIGFIREVMYSIYLTNMVMLKKSSHKWQMCVDFTDLNKAYSEDNYPLPKIDWLVDSTVSFEYPGFLNAYSSYHQIPILLDDEEKTTFITKGEIFYCKAMPFKLKNVGATY